jgi:N-methylhydantoinase A
VTDANVVLGYLDPSSPLAGGVELDRSAAERAVATLGASLGLSLEDTAAGIARVASAEMARAVRVVTVERGIDARELALVPFGGAGPLHAAAIADELGMDRVVVPYSSGVLSALGLVVSERRRDLAESALLTGDGLTRDAVARVVDRLAARGREEIGASDAEVRASYDLRYTGQAFELTVHGGPAPEPHALRAAFDAMHRDHYGFEDQDAALELVTVRVAVAQPGPEPELADPAPGEDRGTRTAIFDGERVDARVVRGAPEQLTGPAIAELPGATLVVPPGWHAERVAAGTLTMERRG